MKDIAAQYEISTYILRMLNRMSEQDTIRPGQVLFVPPPVQD